MKNSILHGIFCKSLFRTSRPIVKLEFSCPEINLKFVQKMLHTAVHVMELHNLDVVKYGITFVK